MGINPGTTGKEPDMNTINTDVLAAEIIAVLIDRYSPDRTAHDLAHAVVTGAGRYGLEYNLTVIHGDGYGILRDGNRLFSINAETDDDGDLWGWTTEIGTAPTDEHPDTDWTRRGRARTVAEVARHAAAWIANN